MIKEGYTSNERIRRKAISSRGNISGLLHDGGITHFPSEEEFLWRFTELPNGITGMNGLSGRNGQERNWLFMLRLRLPGAA